MIKSSTMKGSCVLSEKLKNIKYLALDMDGTLLPDDKRITDYTLEALKEAHLSGYKLCICSGRSFAGVYKYEQLRNIIDYYVCFEGGYIVDNQNPLSPKVIHSVSIPSKALDVIIKSCKDNGAMLALLTNSEGFCLNCESRIYESVRIWGSEPVDIDSSGALNFIGNRDVFISLIYGEKNVIDSIWETFSSEITERFDVINTYLDFKDLHHLVIKAPGVNKWQGLSRVMELNGFGAENLITFGDWHNDFEMIKNAGVGVAMKNAEPAIINAAMVITDHDNNDEGVARFIKQKLLSLK